MTEDPLEMEGWEDNMYRYILESKEFSTDYSGEYKVGRPSRFTKVALFIRSMSEDHKC